MNIKELKALWHLEIIGEGKKFSWYRLFRRIRRSDKKSYLFWFRLSDYLHSSPSRLCKSLAKSINKKLIRKHGVEIMLGAKIGPGLKIIHPIGIVIWAGTVIGNNFTLRQNTTIGTTRVENKPITIGNNVNVGAHSCIIGDGISIGDNVLIGAMSYVKSNIPDNCTYITEKTSRFILKETTDEPLQDTALFTQ